MSYDAKGFQVFGSVPGVSAGTNRALASYTTNDTKATVEGAGYFNSAYPHLPLGSQIFVAGDLDGTPWQCAYVVAANDGSTVTITPAASVSYTAKQTLDVYGVPVTDGTYYLGTAEVAGTIDRIDTILNGGAVATNDAVLTFKINGTSITNGAITIANSGSAAGDQDTASPSAAKTVAVGDKISVVVSGTPGGSRTVAVSMLVTPT